MVEYSNKLASESELDSSYTDAGYAAAFKLPSESAAELVAGGINRTSVEKLEDVLKKVPATSPILRKRKELKKLFLQYLKKYISNPKKFIDHPKQIHNLPSWFDDAIVLFNDSELTREQKRMIREFFIGLIQYRDSKIASGDINTDETNRQLGQRSPYQYTEENIDSISLPRQNEMQKLDIMGIAKNVAAENIKELPQPTMEEYVESDATTPPLDTMYATPPSKNEGGISGVQINRPYRSRTLEDYITPLWKSKPKPVDNQISNLPQSLNAPQSPTTSNLSQSPTMTNLSGTPIPQPSTLSQLQNMQPMISNTSIPQPTIPQQKSSVGSSDINLVSFIMGGKDKPSLFPIRKAPQPVPFQTLPAVQSDIKYRKIKQKKIKPKLNRKSLVMNDKDIKINGISKDMFKDMNMFKNMKISNMSKDIKGDSMFKNMKSGDMFKNIKRDGVPKNMKINGMSKNMKRNANIKSNGISKGISLPNISRSVSLGDISKGISLNNVMGKSVTIKSMKPVRSVKSSKVVPSKSVGALDTIRNMDQVFIQIRNHSKNNYSAGNMKMKIVSDIKNQCENAFKKNKFRTESVNLKKNYFNDVKNAFPEIRMEMKGMGDIHESKVMDRSIKEVPIMLKTNSIPYQVRRGSMRPEPVGITDYDFDLGNVYKKRKKSPHFEEEVIYEE